MQIIDVWGKPCPIPVIETKKAMAEAGTVEILVKVDNSIAVQNLEKMAIGTGYEFSYFEHPGGHYDVTIKRSMNGKEAVYLFPGEEQQEPPPTSDLTVVISRNTMGGGDEELGRILIKGFIYALSELPEIPEFVIFLNSGAYLTSEGSNAADDLKMLEVNGCMVLTCGTCIDFYGLPAPAVGEIADMYGIAEKMVSAKKLINI